MGGYYYILFQASVFLDSLFHRPFTDIPEYAHSMMPQYRIFINSFYAVICYIHCIYIAETYMPVFLPVLPGIYHNIQLLMSRHLSPSPLSDIHPQACLNIRNNLHLYPYRKLYMYDRPHQMVIPAADYAGFLSAPVDSLSRHISFYIKSRLTELAVLPSAPYRSLT